MRGLVLLEGTVTRPGGQIQTVTGVAARLPLRSVQATCQPPAVTIVTGPTSSLIPTGEPSLDDVIVLEGVILTRPVDPADTAAAAQVCALAGMLEEHPNSPNPTWASATAQAAPAVRSSRRHAVTAPARRAPGCLGCVGSAVVPAVSADHCAC